jgi:exopolysaccharide biosynthesis polyprenyl glycosylphosphotransferase
MLAGATALFLAYVVREGQPICGSPFHFCTGAEPYMALIPFAGVIRATFAMRRRPWRKRRLPGYFDETADAVTDAILGSIVLILFTFLFRSGYEFRAFSYSRLVFLYDWIFATILLVALGAITKLMLVWLRRRGHNQRNIVAIRSSRTPSFVANLLSRSPELGYHVVASVDVEANHSDPSTGLQTDLLRVARTAKVDEALLLTPGVSRNVLSQLVGVAELANIEVKAVPELFGLPPTKVTLDEMGNVPVLALLQEPLPGGRRAFKRTMDLVLALPVLVVASPVLAAIAIAVRLSSPGPIVIRQTRIGMDGRPFTFLKFRTMFSDSDTKIHDDYVASLIRGTGEQGNGKGTLFKLTEDPRVTGVGRFLRRYSLDELPQLMNVLRGDMSLVGPRPSLPQEVAMYQDWHRRRLEVRPGMTGLWQVSGRSRMGFVEMVRLDIQYLETWSPLLDIMILLRTVPALVRGETG